jgi:anti-anti-sigma regulatory factor
MVVRISRMEDSETHRLLLRVEGALTHEGAQLLAQQCVPCIHDAEWGVEIDLTAVTFIDEAAAAVVRRLSQSPSVSLTGCQLFTQQLMEAVLQWKAVRCSNGGGSRHVEMVTIVYQRELECHDSAGYPIYKGGINASSERSKVN